MEANEQESHFLNLSTLVKGTPLLFQDGSIALPAYHELIGVFGELLRINRTGQVIGKRRLSRGTLASSFHGVPRSSLDIDLLTSLLPKQVEPLVAAKLLPLGCESTALLIAQAETTTQLLLQKLSSLSGLGATFRERIQCPMMLPSGSINNE